jgi:hypothetical protein
LVRDSYFDGKGSNMSRELGITEVTISRALNAQNADAVNRVGNVLHVKKGVSTAWLLDGAGPMFIDNADKIEPPADDTGEDPMRAGGEGGVETFDLDLGPGEYRKRLIPVPNEHGEIEYYIKAVYTRLTKEEGDAEKRADGVG